jgi:3-hydroxy-9,10-secoandrosta-1,3,5(10)-triene-9,17-dione monooxygenase
VLDFADPNMQVLAKEPGRAFHSNPLYHGPILPLLFCKLTSVALGTARGALDVYEQILLARKALLPPFTPRHEMPEYQHHFRPRAGAYRYGRGRAAEPCLHVDGDRRPGGSRHPLVARGRTAFPARCATMRRTRLGSDGPDVPHAGSSAAKKSSTLARYFRNLAVIRTHITAQIHHTSMNVGRIHFGLPPLSTL